MATRKSTTVRPVTIDLDQFPGAAIYRTAPDEFWPMFMGHIVSEQPYTSQSAAECPAIAAWVQAHPECQVTADTEADLLALEARAQLLDEQADADAALAEHLLGELHEIEAQRTAALVNGERYDGEAESLDRAYDRKREQLRQLGYDVTAGQATGWALELTYVDPAEVWRAGQERMREIARDLGLLAPEQPVHPDPAMDVATFAAVWDARSDSLGRVARALRGEA